jgi:hypothetical protein
MNLHPRIRSPLTRLPIPPLPPAPAVTLAPALWLILALALPGCRSGSPTSAAEILVRCDGGDLPDRGLTFGGVLMDCDGDGWSDLLMSRHGDTAEVYLNRGGLRFLSPEHAKEMIELPEGLADQHGAAACDYDRDGDWDVYITLGAERGWELSWNQLWEQVAPGRFRDALSGEPEAVRSVAADPVGRGRGGLWADLDGDLVPELLLLDYQSQARLLRRAGEHWQDATGWLPTLPAVPLWSPGMPPPSPEDRARATWIHAAVADDIDGDGRTDLLALGRPGWSGLWRNLGPGRLQDVTCSWGLSPALWPDVPSHAAAGDVDEDGDLDLIFAYRPQQKDPLLARNQIELWLQERTEYGPMFHRAAFSGDPGSAQVVEAVLLCDLDNDGHLDLYVVQNGRQPAPAPNLLLLGLGDGRFQPAPRGNWALEQAGFAESAWPADLDRDGDLDLLVFRGGGLDPKQGGGLVLYENRTAGRGLTLELVSRRGAPHGLGARIELAGPSSRQVRRISSLAAPLSSCILPAHFGLGSEHGPWRARIDWPAGETQEVVLPEAGRAYRLFEETGELQELPRTWHPASGRR